MLAEAGLPAMAQLDLGSRQDSYLHAVATQNGLRLDEHLNELTERPPLAQVLAAGRERDTVA